MARKVSVEIVGDASSLERAFRSASKSAGRFDNDLGRSARGAVAASVSFRGLGRSIAFASGYFLGGAGIVYGIKSTITAAERSQAVLAQTSNAVRKSGLSWKAYGDTIKEAALAQSNISGFDDERLLGTFSLLVRRTGDVNRALKLNALAADVARGRNISLESAAQLVTKASLGMAGALRRVGIDAKNGSTGIQLIDMLSKKYAGSAAAYGKTAAGAQDRFRVAVENLQEAVGKGLLPTITHYLDIASTWLNNSKNQERVQRDVSEAAKTLNSVLKTTAHVVGEVSDAVGGFKHLLELLIGLKIATWAMGVTGGIRGIGTSAAESEGKVSLLRTRLLGLGAISIAPIVIPIVIEGAQGLSKWLGKNVGHGIGDTPRPPGVSIADVVKLKKDLDSGNLTKRDREVYKAWTGKNVPTALGPPSGGGKPSPDRGFRDANLRAGSGGGDGSGSTSTATPYLSYLLSVAQSTASTSDDKSILGRIIALLKGRLSGAKTLAAKTALQDAINGYTDQLAGLVVDGTKHAAKHAKTKKAAPHVERAFAEPMQLLIAQAKAQATGSESQQIAVAKQMKAFALKMIRSNKLKGQALIDAWNEIANDNATINGGKASTTGDPHGRRGFRSASLASLTAGIKDAAVRKQVEQRIAQAQAHSGHVPTGHGVLGDTIYITNLNVHGGDPDKIIEHAKRKAKKGVAQRRGPHAGSYMGLH